MKNETAFFRLYQLCLCVNRRVFFYFSISIRALFPFRITQIERISEFLRASIEIDNNSNSNDTKKLETQYTEQQQQINIELIDEFEMIWYDN